MWEERLSEPLVRCRAASAAGLQGKCSRKIYVCSQTLADTTGRHRYHSISDIMSCPSLSCPVLSHHSMMYTVTCVCMYVILSLSLYIYIYIERDISNQTHIHVCIKYIYVCMYTYVYICIHTYIYIYIHMHICIYIYIYIHMITCIARWSP